MDISLMAAVPHRIYNRSHFHSGTLIHSFNACCEALMKLSRTLDVNGKTILFVPFIALDAEGVTRDVYEKWLNCLKVTGIKWEYSTLDKWVKMASWNEDPDGDTEDMRRSVERKGKVKLRYFEYGFRKKERFVPHEGVYRLAYGRAPETGREQRNIEWNEPGYLISLNFVGGTVEGELHRLSNINRMVRFPYFKGSDWQDKGYFMNIWEYYLYNNYMLDDWAKISLSFLLMPDIDTTCQNSYFFPFGKKNDHCWPNTLKNFNRVGEGWRADLCRAFRVIPTPWAEFPTGSLRPNINRDDLRKALLSTEDNVQYFIDAIERVLRMSASHPFQGFRSEVEGRDIRILKEFIRTHTKYKIRDDIQMEVRKRPGVSFTTSAEAEAHISGGFIELFED
jgi:hypothetical protein